MPTSSEPSTASACGSILAELNDTERQLEHATDGPVAALRVLLLPRYGWLNDVDPETQIHLGSLAWTRWQATRSASLSDYGDIVDGVQPIRRYSN